MLLRDARCLASQVERLLRPACERILVAGSIRREKANVTDIEIVCESQLIPAARSLFDPTLEQAIHRHVDRLVGPESALQLDPRLPRNGPKYKRLLWREHDRGPEIAVDLFIVSPPATWGAILAIRTGPADFSKLLVTPRAKGGAMPAGHVMQDGTLVGPRGPIACDEEEDLFAALGIPCWVPRERTAFRLEKFLRERTRHANALTESR